MSGGGSVAAASSPGLSKARVALLDRCLAIRLIKVHSSDPDATLQPSSGRGTASEYWMYDAGYLLFQGLLEANLKCFWNLALVEAIKVLQYRGWVSPGVLLVTSTPCALEVLRAAWARNVLRAPSNYKIHSIGDVDEFSVQPLSQGQFTPLPEALCRVILELTSTGQCAAAPRIRAALRQAFPAMHQPSHELVYDALAQLMQENKVYQTSKGYFIVTPERRRRQERRAEASASRRLLMSAEEAVAYLHGEMETLRDGQVTHQAVQTNLADVICGGNSSDKVLFPRTRRASSFPERRHSMRLFGSHRRLSRAASLKHLVETQQQPPKKSSLLSRLFRRSKRGKSVPPPLATFSAQFPPPEWFNQRVGPLHSVATQTSSREESQVTLAWPSSPGPTELETPSSVPRASTLPRRHRRHPSGDWTPSSSRRHRSPLGTSRSTSRTSVIPANRQAAASVSPRRETLRYPNSNGHNGTGESTKAQSIYSAGSTNSSVTLTAKSRSAGSGASSPAKSLRSTELSNSSPTKSPARSLKHTPAPLTPNLQPPPTPVKTNNHAKPRKISNIEENRGNDRSSIVLQVSTSPTATATATTTTSIGGNTNTKILVTQQGSPVRSLITLESGSEPVRVITKEPEPAPEVKELSKSTQDINTDRNILTRKQSNTDLNNTRTTPGSPTKLRESLSFKNVFPLGSQELLKRQESYPSLSDLTVHFKSLAAQKILKGVSINSIDTLVEVNMAAAEKQNNCDVTIHTDFGLV